MYMYIYNIVGINIVYNGARILPVVAPVAHHFMHWFKKINTVM